MPWEAVIGLEVHAQLLTDSKIFCGCSTKFGAGPNENTCPVCLGLPGALPVLNEKAVALAVRAGIALECEIPPSSVFARKNYFYPDLPKGYQISQFDRPLAVNGKLNLENGRTIRVKRIHMEEDAGKLLHEGVEEKVRASYVDLNRSGVPLIEIVSEPDLHSSDEVYDYLSQLKTILQFTEISDANMEEGNLRCDANISLRSAGSQELGTKVEIKNLNSFKNVQRALEFEIKRQSEALNAGNRIQQETRLYDADRDSTHSMRSKEEAHDYRYFPDPDLLPCTVTEELKAEVRNSLPELPAALKQRFVSQYGLAAKEAEVLAAERRRAMRFEAAAKASGNPKQTANWVLRAPDAHLPAKHIEALIQLVQSGAISTDQAKTVFDEMIAGGKAPEEIVREKGLTQISGEAEIERIVGNVLSAQQAIVERYRQGETKLLGVLVGEVMKASGGKANPKIANTVLRRRLDSGT